MLSWSSSSGWVAGPAPSGGTSVDPRYICDPSTGIQTIDFTSGAPGATVVDITNAVWLQVIGSNSGATESLVIPNIADSDGPAGRRLIISDMVDLTESSAIQISIAAGSGTIPGQIDGGSEEIFDFASLSIVCTGQRVGGDATAGLIWKII